MGSFCHALPWYTLILFSEVWWNPSWYCLTLSQVAKQIYGSQLVLQIFSWFRGTSVGRQQGLCPDCQVFGLSLVFSKFFKGQKSMNAYCFSPWQVLTSAFAWCTCGVTRLKISGTQHWYQQEAVLFHRTTRLPAAIRPRQTPAGWGQNAHSASVGLCLPNTTRA